MKVDLSKHNPKIESRLKVKLNCLKLNSQVKLGWFKGQAELVSIESQAK